MSGYLSRPDPVVGAVLGSVQRGIGSLAGSSLVGLYLCGSLASDDFDPGISDIDLIAVLVDAPDERLAARLGRMHEDLAQANPGWDDRIEVIYVSKQGLANCRTAATTVAIISPGEPFHVVRAGTEWIVSWYPARQDGVRLLGPPIDELIPDIPTAEYIDEVRRYLIGFADRVPDDDPPASQAYAILTMCRGLSTIRFGERLSKRGAAAWAQHELPEWADLIRRALGWREHQHDPEEQNGTAAMLMLAAVEFGSVALATTVFVPVSGYETCTPTSGGDVWTTPDGVVHVRGEVYECTFATASTVPYLQGGETVIINYNLDTTTGSGALWGTFHSELAGYSSETGFAGTWNGQFSAFAWSGRLVGNGYGELGGWKMRLSIQPDSPVSDYLSGFVFAPAR